MVQFNLLPDVKLNYIKAKKTKRMTILSATLAGGAALFLLVMLFLVVNVFQKQHLKNLNNDIKTYSTQLQNTPDLNKILTIQNQLNSLTGLHSQKVVASRLFGYLSKLTPAKASITKVDIDFTTNKLTISGTADSLTTINKYADTLKFTTYKTDDGKTGNAMSSVVLTSFSNGSDGTYTYQLDMQFDPVIFQSSSNVTLSVPHIVSTRSETEKPTDLFQSGSNSNSTTGGQ